MNKELLDQITMSLKPSDVKTTDNDFSFDLIADKEPLFEDLARVSASITWLGGTMFEVDKDNIKVFGKWKFELTPCNGPHKLYDFVGSLPVSSSFYPAILSKAVTSDSPN